MSNIESQHPPVNILVNLAQSMNITTDALFEITPTEATPLSSRLERRIKQIEILCPKPRQQISQLIDTFIETEQLKQKANATQ